MPPTRLFETAEGDRFFGVKRFDRDRNQRFHVHTFGNLIEANFRIPSSDYGDLLKATTILTNNHQQVLRVFRHMVFNVLAHNRDDHVKNFAFILDDRSGEWSLTPAYDLTFTTGPGGVQQGTARKQTPVTVIVYDVAGRKVKDLVRRFVFDAVLTLFWDGTNNNNEKVPSGMYFIKAVSGQVTDVKKVMILR